MAYSRLGVSFMLVGLLFIGIAYFAPSSSASFQTTSISTSATSSSSSSSSSSSTSTTTSTSTNTSSSTTAVSAQVTILNGGNPLTTTVTLQTQAGQTVASGMTSASTGTYAFNANVPIPSNLNVFITVPAGVTVSNAVFCASQNLISSYGNPVANAPSLNSAIPPGTCEEQYLTVNSPNASATFDINPANPCLGPNSPYGSHSYVQCATQYQSIVQIPGIGGVNSLYFAYLGAGSFIMGLALFTIGGKVKHGI